MKINIRGFIFVLPLFCLANFLFGQNNDSRSKYRIAWTKDEYALHYEVIIEKEENNAYSPALRELTEEPFIVFTLPPGNYRIRVTPYDFREIAGMGTGWKNFKILAAKTSDSELQTEETELTQPVKHNGNYFGVLGEMSGYTLNSTAFGFGGVFGRSFNGVGLGIAIHYAKDNEGFTFFETLAHIRFYTSRKKPNTGFFLQAEGGIFLFAHDKPAITMGDLSGAGGLCAGWRFPLGNYFFFEPAIRAGYPYLYGASFSMGIRF